MKIDNSSIAMSSLTSSYKSYYKEESLRTWAGRPDSRGESRLAGLPLLTQEDILELSDQAKQFLRQSTAASVNQAGLSSDDEVFLEISDRDKIKIQLVQQMIESLTGKKIKFYGLDKVKIKKSDINIKVNPANSGSASVQARQLPAGWGLEYDRRESYTEKEIMSYAARGIIKTADGREINISVSLNMSREFAVERNVSIRAGDAVAKDPLVINFNGAAPSLTDTKFSFDLDADGNSENISFVRPGSGFLALDLNGDNRINNGSELFGPSSGNGFAELSQYDEDGNNWIDENDPVFSRLRIWTRDAEGNESLFALGQKGIGAIYLGNLTSLFNLKDGCNNLQGQIKSTGIYLDENGAAGTIQQLDLVID